MTHPSNAWMNDPVKVARIRQEQEDMRWALENYNALDECYHGEYVAVLRKQVVGHGADLGELLEQMERAGFAQGEVAIVEFPTFFETPH